MKVRERTDDDLEWCERMARVVHQLDGYPPRMAHDLRRFITATGAIGAWVAQAGEDVVGHVALQPRSSAAVMALAGEATGRTPDRLAVVARLLVSPAERGRGVGRALLTTAADAAVARGRWPILDVATHFDAAIRLYRRAGWTCAGRLTVRLEKLEPLEELVFIGPAPPAEPAED